MSLALVDGDSLTYDAGWMSVPMNRAADSTGSIEVEFHRFYAAERVETTPPVFMLDGGPGGDGLAPLLERAGFYEAQLEAFAEHSDLVFPGQRGFGRSQPTRCEWGPELSNAEAQSPDVRRSALRDAMNACRAQYEDQGVDLEGFDVIQAAHDVADLARALGYDEIQLVGSSFGSHWAMAVMRLYPDLVTRATLSAIEGPDHTFDTSSDVAASLGRIAEAAEASGIWDLPPEGIFAAHESRLASLAGAPLSVVAPDLDTEDPVDVSLTSAEVRGLIWGYSTGTQFPPQIGRWPNEVVELLSGDFAGAASELLWIWRNVRVRDAAYYQYECVSGASPTRLARLESDPRNELVGQVSAENVEQCALWGVEQNPWFGEPFTTSIPSLLVHGTWDTSTPIENLFEMQESFAEQRTVVVEQGSHGAFLQALDVPEFRAGLSGWLRDGDWSGVPERVGVEGARWVRR
ncbi:MAG: alpha/beta hydrolase [Gemmatimonadota bacterium]